MVGRVSHQTELLIVSSLLEMAVEATLAALVGLAALARSLAAFSAPLAQAHHHPWLLPIWIDVA
jgi:hypothetical protein